MNKIVLTLLLLFLACQNCNAKNKELSIVDCSEVSRQEILFIANSMKVQGYKTPNVITCDSVEVEKIYNLYPIPNLPFSKIGGLTLSTIDGKDEFIFIKEGSRVFSISRVLSHELGHYNQRLRIGYKGMNKHTMRGVRDDLKPLIIKNISSYATSTEAEFVAEYFSLIQMGYKMPRELKRYYKKCNGI